MDDFGWKTACLGVELQTGFPGPVTMSPSRMALKLFSHPEDCPIPLLPLQFDAGAAAPNGIVRQSNDGILNNRYAIPASIFNCDGFSLASLQGLGTTEELTG